MAARARSPEPPRISPTETGLPSGGIAQTSHTLPGGAGSRSATTSGLRSDASTTAPPPVPPGPDNATTRAPGAASAWLTSAAESRSASSLPARSRSDRNSTPSSTAASAKAAAKLRDGVKISLNRRRGFAAGARRRAPRRPAARRRSCGVARAAVRMRSRRSAGGSAPGTLRASAAAVSSASSKAARHDAQPARCACTASASAGSSASSACAETSTSSSSWVWPAGAMDPQSAPVSARRTRRRVSAACVRDLTVPSGSPSRSDSSDCVSPSK